MQTTTQCIICKCDMDGDGAPICRGCDPAEIAGDIYRQRQELAEALLKCLKRMESESEWLNKADYPARFMVERHDSVLSPARAALRAAGLID